MTLPITEPREIEDDLSTQTAPVPALALQGRQEAKSARTDLTIFYLVADLILVFASACLATLSRFPLSTPDWGTTSETSVIKHLGFLVLYAGLLVLSCHVYKVYDGNGIRSSHDEIGAVLKAVGMATLLVAAFIYLSGVKTISRVVVGETVALSTISMIGWRQVRRKRIVDGLHCRNVLIVNAGPMGRDLENHLSQNRHLGFAVKGYLDRRQNRTHTHYPERRRETPDPKILGSVLDLARVARSNFIDEIFIVTPENRDLVKHLIFEARLNGVDVRVVPDQYDGLAAAAPIEYVGHIPLMSFCHQSVPTFGLLIKRYIDILLALSALLVLTPLFLVVALIIRLTSPGSVFTTRREWERRVRSLRATSSGRWYRMRMSYAIPYIT